ncbi:MAG: 3-beta hydroxysteroid dehydrogenase [Planctomycetaceae bacterium]|nr:3-beta hydroxysteroid dehydrogenase [Planctomycetaceae bacterium]MBP60198.1 3-beta hydroxysteroid dehydrogenase [Planctomycetaceae bacterium]
MRTLVTGGNGFLGQYIVEQLVAQGDVVRSLSRRPSTALKALGVETMLGDMRDPGIAQRACQDVDFVFHVAGVAGIWGPWKYFHGINTWATEQLVTGAIQAGVQKFIYTSSPSVTFDGTDQEYVDESEPYPSRWLCHYQHSKALAEQHVLQANNGNSFLTCALRPHLIWGPRDQHLVPRLLERARAGRLRQVGDGQNLIDMIYVENAARAHLLAAKALTPGSAVGGNAYFISQDQPVNCWKWINQILALADIPPIRKSISRSAAWYLGGVMELVHTLLGRTSEPPMTRFLAAQLATHHYFDISRAKRDFNFQPEISTEEGMRRLKDAW